MFVSCLQCYLQIHCAKLSKIDEFVAVACGGRMLVGSRWRFKFSTWFSSRLRNQLPISPFIWRRPASNRQPQACKASALPIELRPREMGLGARGFEPRTSALSGLRSNQLSYAPADKIFRLSRLGCKASCKGSPFDRPTLRLRCEFVLTRNRFGGILTIIYAAQRPGRSRSSHRTK